MDWAKTTARRDETCILDMGFGTSNMIDLIVMHSEQSTVDPYMGANRMNIGSIESIDYDVIKWKHFPRYWPFVRGIHRSTVNSPHKDQWRGALMFHLIYTWINNWINNRGSGDLGRHRAHHDVRVMRRTSCRQILTQNQVNNEHRKRRVEHYTKSATDWPLPTNIHVILVSRLRNINSTQCWNLVTRIWFLCFDTVETANSINSLRTRQNGSQFPGNIFTCNYLN